MTVEPPCSLTDRARDWFRIGADALGHPYAIIGLALLWIPWAVSGEDFRGALDHWLTGGAFTGFQMVLAGQRVERAANAAQQAEIVRAIPGADDDMADADRMTLGEIEERRR